MDTFGGLETLRLLVRSRAFGIIAGAAVALTIGGALGVAIGSDKPPRGAVQFSTITRHGTKTIVAVSTLPRKVVKHRVTVTHRRTVTRPGSSGTVTETKTLPGRTITITKKVTTTRTITVPTTVTTTETVTTTT